MSLEPKLHSDQFGVFDDFLSPEGASRVANYFDNDEFEFIASGKWRKVFRLTDGQILKGKEVFEQNSPYVLGAPIYPTGNGVDEIISKLADSAPHFDHWIGERGGQWTTFSIRPYIYPAGSGLSWHVDDGYAGAFIYYCHSTWDQNWGGELLVDGCSTSDTTASSGVFIAPRPNRLIILKGGVPHCIKKVEMRAGEAIRKSMTGFFYDAKRLAST